LGDVAEYVNGAAFKESDWGVEGRRIIRIQNLNDPTKPYNRTSRTVKDSIVVRPGDLLVSWSASLGVYEWSGPDEAVLNQHIFRVIPDANIVDRSYLRHTLKSSLDRLKMQVHGATMKHLTRSVFLQTSILLPPIEEQRRIAAVLDAADALCGKRRQALAKLDTLTQAIFVDMFGDPVANTKAWEEARLGDVLARIDSGRSPVCLDRPAYDGEWGVLKAGAVTYCEFDGAQSKALPPDIQPDSRHEVFAGDVLFARKNTHDLVAASAYVYETQPRLLMSDLIFRLVIDEPDRLNPIFLQAQLVHPRLRRGIQQMAGGSSGSMPNISKSKLGTVPICVPPGEQQSAFAAAVFASRRVRSDMMNDADATDTLFSALQQRAFRGEL
jgi:type I restriction enzyme S subunit